jgi:hypothetical protein
MENQPNQPQPSKPANQALWIILILVVLALAGYGVYAYIAGNTNNANNANTTSNINQATNTNTASNSNSAVNANSNVNTTTNTNIDTSGWKTYTDVKFGFSFDYPQNWNLSTYPNGTISVVPPSFQEPTPLIKAIEGSVMKARDWVLANWVDPNAGPLQKTIKTYSFSDFSGDVYAINNHDYAIITELGNYSMIIRINVIQNEIPFIDYTAEYEGILKSIEI